MTITIGGIIGIAIGFCFGVFAGGITGGLIVENYWHKRFIKYRENTKNSDDALYEVEPGKKYLVIKKGDNIKND